MKSLPMKFLHRAFAYAARWVPVWLALTAVAACQRAGIGSEAAQRPPAVSESTWQPPRDNGVAFVAIGDGGHPGPIRDATVALNKALCARVACDATVLLGDNIYPAGADPTWPDTFLSSYLEAPYGAARGPVFGALGNHDHMGDVARQVRFGSRASVPRDGQFFMPEPVYAVRVPLEVGDVVVLALDTTVLDMAQAERARAYLRALPKDVFRLVIGHHPLDSSGLHGPARGEPRKALERVLCGQADAYLAGHDHHLEVRAPRCGVTSVISGAASKLRPLSKSISGAFTASEPGLVLLSIGKHGLNGRVLGMQGELYGFHVPRGQHTDPKARLQGGVPQ